MRRLSVCLSGFLSVRRSICLYDRICHLSETNVGKFSNWTSLTQNHENGSFSILCWFQPIKLLLLRFGMTKELIEKCKFRFHSKITLHLTRSLVLWVTEFTISMARASLWGLSSCAYFIWLLFQSLFLGFYLSTENIHYCYYLSTLAMPPRL